MNEENRIMIEKLKREGYLSSKRIENAFLSFPRHLFVPEDYLDYAYVDTPIPIGEDSTISAFHMVAIMLEILNPKKGEKVLEIGTGSGWQAALLSYLVGENGLVVSVEINKDVYKFAKKNLEKLKLRNVKVILGDGSVGYKSLAPYDKIIVTAACAFNIPKPLIGQLKEGGILVAPVEKEFGYQELVKLRKTGGKNEMERLMGVAFVKLKGKYGFE